MNRRNNNEKYVNALINYGKKAEIMVERMVVQNTGYCYTQTTGYSPVLTGKNKNSIKYEAQKNGGVVIGKVYSGTDYAVGLEIGRIGRSATPYFLPGFEDTLVKQEKDSLNIYKELKREVDLL